MSNVPGLAIMVWSCDLAKPENLATPFMAAQAAAALDLDVEMLFTAQAISWLLPAHGERLAGFGTQSRCVREYLETCATMGIRVYACSQAMAGAGLRTEELVPQCSGHSGMVAFVERSIDPDWRTLVF
ncbi:MAG: DsrE family protein [Janthinobacterium lividum]